MIAARLLALGATTVAVISCVGAAAPARGSAASPSTSAGCRAGQRTALPSTVDGRAFGHHVPDHRGTAALALILAFHGAKQTPESIERYSSLDEARAVVVYPEGRTFPGSTTRGWAPNDKLPELSPDLTYTRDLVTAVEKAFCVDTARVYATGKSEGGGFTYALACHEPGLLAAIAPVAGAFYRPGRTYHGVDPATCGSGPLRVLDFHGARDSVIPYSDTYVPAGHHHPVGMSGRSRPIRTTSQFPDDLGWTNEWVARDDCGAHSTDTGTHRVRTTWTGCRQGTAVTQYKLLDGGHTWPGATSSSGGGNDPTDHVVDATAVMLTFFGVARS